MADHPIESPGKVTSIPDGATLMSAENPALVGTHWSAASESDGIWAAKDFESASAVKTTFDEKALCR